MAEGVQFLCEEALQDPDGLMCIRGIDDRDEELQGRPNPLALQPRHGSRLEDGLLDEDDVEPFGRMAEKMLWTLPDEIPA